MIAQQATQADVPAVAMPAITFHAAGKCTTYLPNGKWQLSVREGSVWVLCEGEQFVAHTGETVTVNATHDNATVRNLHAAIGVTFTLTPQP